MPQLGLEPIKNLLAIEKISQGIATDGLNFPDDVVSWRRNQGNIHMWKRIQIVIESKREWTKNLRNSTCWWYTVLYSLSLWSIANCCRDSQENHDRNKIRPIDKVTKIENGSKKCSDTRCIAANKRKSFWRKLFQHQKIEWPDNKISKIMLDDRVTIQPISESHCRQLSGWISLKRVTLTISLNL